ncbi:MAG TPA: glycosyltransferase family 2 protein [Candidatus Polarisedimenticolia bacterium]|jgi:glycosyltransferase involved in cell wall biosynthesis|nr:glycosyltransferase family 2 protein [Candidatus Polarisedimenticolia bacterium]
MTRPAASRVALLIPAYNEEAALPLVLRAIPDGIVDEVVVVDNGSTDGTARVAREHGARVVPEPRRGYGAACLAGLSHLMRDPPDIVVFMDADFSDRPEEMPRLLAALRESECDLVIGSRTLGKAEPGALLPQARFGNRLATLLLRVLFGARYTDLGPFRAARFDRLVALGMTDRDYGWTVEMQARAALEGWKTAEVSVSYRRRVGTSKITGTFRGSWRAGTKILTTLLRLRLMGNGSGPRRNP